ncbi:MAG TPA: hypothetical protein VFB73_10325 [Chloroflexota bacterium]|nr:hypothetical protein [Chloroflexota bacterium]
MLGWGFTARAVAELGYMIYHLGWTLFLFAQTIAEVLDLVGFALSLAYATQRVFASARAIAAP